MAQLMSAIDKINRESAREKVRGYVVCNACRKVRLTLNKATRKQRERDRLSAMEPELFD